MDKLPKTDRRKAKIEHYQIQILQSGEKCDNASDKCYKKENHKNYITVQELEQCASSQENDLFIKIRKDDKLLAMVQTICRLTALVETQTDEGTRCGSCFVQKIDRVKNRPCPCSKCQDHGGQCEEWGKVTLTTALHVIPNEADAKKCMVRFFYDRPDSQDVKIYGWGIHSRDDVGDWCSLVCVTHDLELIKKLTGDLSNYWKLGHELKEKYKNDSNSELVIVVSHPHGGPKLVSIGKGKVKDLAREVRDDQDWCYYSYDATTCDGSSGGPVYVLGRWNDGCGYWFGHSHNHSGVDARNNNSSTVGVFSTHGCLTKPYSSNLLDSFSET